MKTVIWRVEVSDENYSRNLTMLLRGKSAAAVEKAALRRAKEGDKDLVRGERKHKPYIRSIELIGELTE